MKKFMVIAMVLLSLLLLASCGGGGEDPTTTVPSTKETTTEPVTESESAKALAEFRKHMKDESQNSYDEKQGEVAHLKGDVLAIQPYMITIDSWGRLNNYTYKDANGNKKIVKFNDYKLEMIETLQNLVNSLPNCPFTKEQESSSCHCGCGSCHCG